METICIKYQTRFLGRIREIVKKCRLLILYSFDICTGSTVTTNTICITKTYLYNFAPLKSPFYIVKLGFTGVYIIFLISAQKQRLWPASVAQLYAPSDWRPGGRGFNPRRGRQHSFVEKLIMKYFLVILSLPLIQEGQLSVSGERMCTILVNCLED